MLFISGMLRLLLTENISVRVARAQAAAQDLAPVPALSRAPSPVLAPSPRIRKEDPVLGTRRGGLGTEDLAPGKGRANVADQGPSLDQSLERESHVPEIGSPEIRSLLNEDPSLQNTKMQNPSRNPDQNLSPGPGRDLKVLNAAPLKLRTRRQMKRWRKDPDQSPNLVPNLAPNLAPNPAPNPAQGLDLDPGNITLLWTFVLQ